MKRFRTCFFCLVLLILAALGPGCATTHYHTAIKGTDLEQETVKTPTEDFTSYLIWGLFESLYGLGQCGTTFEIK